MNDEQHYQNILDENTEYFQSLKDKRKKLVNELIHLALKMADDGRILYEKKEELRVVGIQIMKYGKVQSSQVL